MNHNEVIADFMGMKPHHQDSGCLIRVDDNGSNEVVPIEELAYYTSWDWLMPVVEKINRLTDDWGNTNDFTIGNGYVWVDPHIGDRIFFSGNNPEDKEEPMRSKVYRGVLAFIKLNSVVEFIEPQIQ